MTTVRTATFFLCLSALGTDEAETMPLPQGAKPVVVVVAAAEGGAADIVARAFASALKAELDVPVTIRNLPGNGGTDGIQSVAQASDELRVGIVNNTGLVPGLLLRQGRFEASDFDWIGVIGTYPNAIVSAKPAAPPLGEWLRQQRDTPGRAGANVPGAMNYLALRFLQVSGVAAPYTEISQPAVGYQMLRSGQLDYLLDGLPSALASGLKIVGLATQARVDGLPSLQAWGEYLPSPPFEVLIAIAVSSRESSELREWIKAAWNGIRTRQEFTDRIRALGVRYRGIGPDRSRAYVEDAFLEHAVLLGRYLPGKSPEPDKGRTELDPKSRGMAIRSDGFTPASMTR